MSEDFNDVSADQSRGSKDRAKYLGLVKHMQTTGFVTDQANMKDVLWELSDLSLNLQT